MAEPFEDPTLIKGVATLFFFMPLFARPAFAQYLYPDTHTAKGGLHATPTLYG